MDWEAPPFIAATMVSGHFARVPRYCDKLRQSSGLAAQQPHSGQELVDWLATQARVTTRLVSKLQAELKSSGVDVRFGRGSLLDANTIRVQSDSGQTELVRADHLILATGSRPDVGGEDLGPGFVNIDQFLRRSYFPQRSLIIGGGYVGCEIASILRSLGSIVTLVEKSHLLPDWDQFISSFIARTLHDSGVRLHFGQELD